MPDVTDCAAVTDSHLYAITGTMIISDVAPLTLQNGDFAGLSDLEFLYLNLNNLSILPADVFDGLTGLKELYLYNNNLTALPEGIFDDLGRLENLNLGYNSIATLRADAFDGLSELRELHLEHNDLASLPDGLFDGLTNLTTLNLVANDLQSLPSGTFSGLGSLQTLRLSGNPGAPFTFTAALSEPETGKVAVTVVEGAPVDMTVTLSASGGTLSATTVTIDGGETSSDAVTVTQDGSEAVTVSVESVVFDSTAVLEGLQTGQGEDLQLADSTPEVTTAPSISSITITSDPDDDAHIGVFYTGVYGIDDSIEVTVTFSEDVTVTGTPRLRVDIGGTAKTASYESVEGSAVVFSYTVAEGDSDTNGIAIGANKLTLNGGTIKDAAENAANLSHDALLAQNSHKVDGIRPRLTGVEFINTFQGINNGFYTAGEKLYIDAEWSERIHLSYDTAPTMSVDFDGTTKTFTLASRFDSTSYAYTIQSGDYDADRPTAAANAAQLGTGWVQDTAGNPAVLTHAALTANSLFKVDAILPYVTGIEIMSSPASSGGYTTGETIEITVTFNETVTVPQIGRSDIPGTPKPKIELDIGGQARIANFRSTNANSVLFAYTVTTGDEDSDGVSISANKLTQNGGAIIDQTRNTPLTTEEEWILGLDVDAAVTHPALDDDASHKVSGGASSPVTLSGDTTINYEENGEGAVATYTLSGSDNAITWSLLGDDSDDFSLAGSSATWRQLRFTSSPNFEDPTDADTDNQYDVTIQASDGTNTSILQVTVFVTNVLRDADELPVIIGTAQVGETLTVDTSPIPDADENTTFGYLWIRTDGDTDTNIDGARGTGSAFSSYTLTSDDEGKTIKVQVGFWSTDGTLPYLRSAPTETVVMGGL